MTQNPEVLVVEDDDAVRHALTRLLAHEDVCAIGAATLGIARAGVRAHFPTLRAVIVDLGLGRESGVEFVRELQADHPGLPVLVFSAEGDSFTRAELLALGAREVLTKPAPSNAILAAVRRVIGDGAQRTAGGWLRTHPSRGESRTS